MSNLFPDGICVFASIVDDTTCTIHNENHECCGDVGHCPIRKERQEAMEAFFIEMDLLDADSAISAQGELSAS
jgi:hypothetical protein